MEITTHSAQIRVSDSEGSSGTNLHRRCSGYVADLQTWGDSIYLARRPGESGLHILIAPSAKWKDDIRAEGFEIVGKLSRLANTPVNPTL
jgi:hypothetical protein